MKNKARKKYSTEFKREAVDLVVDHGYSKAEAGRSLDVNPNLIRRWQREFEADSTDAFAGQGKQTPDQRRIRELETENRRLRMEKDILKKATVGMPHHFFIQEKS